MHYIYIFKTAVFNNLIIKFIDSCYENADIFELLHQYYKRAIYYEFDINRRDNDFIQGWIKVGVALVD